MSPLCLKISNGFLLLSFSKYLLGRVQGTGDTKGIGYRLYPQRIHIGKETSALMTKLILLAN